VDFSKPVPLILSSRPGLLFSRVSAARTVAAKPHGRVYGVPMERAVPAWARKIAIFSTFKALLRLCLPERRKNYQCAGATHNILHSNNNLVIPITAGAAYHGRQSTNEQHHFHVFR